MLPNNTKSHPLVPVINRASIPVILWNLTPFIGYLFLGWEAITVFMCYAMETIMLGVFNVFKLLLVYKYGLPQAADEKGVSGLGIIPFFIFHYYFFVFVQLSVFMGTANFAGHSGFDVVGLVKDFMQQRDAQIALAVFTTSTAYSTVADFILPGVYRQRTMMRQMFEPYGRIFVQQFVVILGSMLYLFFGGALFLAVFVGIKTWFDLLFTGRSLLDWAIEKQKELKARGELPEDNSWN